MLIRKLEDFRRWSAGFNWSFFAFDTETTGLDWFELDIEGISFCDGVSSAYVDFVDNKDREAILTEFFNTVISSHCVEKVVGHSLVFDLKVLAKLYGKAAIDDFMYHTVLIDTYLAAYLLDERENHSLKKPGGCCERYLNRFPMTFTDVESQNRRSEKFAKYAEDDAINTWDLWQVLRQEIFDQNLQQVFFIESRFIPVQVEMELSGITVDQDLLKELETNLDTMKLELIGELEKIAGPGLKLQRGLFGNSDIERKLNSPKEMVSFITNHLGIPVVNTSAETVAEHNDKHPFFPLFAKYKVVHTLLSNFVSPYWDWIKPDGKVHPHFRIQRSGRIAAIEPHLSNQAKENEKLPDANIRSLLTAGEGNSLLRIDYSGQEMRIDAHLTGDENMIRAFRDDIDVHMFVANRVNKLGIPEEYLVETHPKYKEIREKYAAERTKFKAINFGLIYGKTVAGFAREWKVEYMEAAKVVGDFFQEFPKIREAMDYWKKFQARTGYTVNCVGRRRRYNQPMDDGSYRSGFNHLHQSLGADMMKKAAGECWRYKHPKNLPIDIVLTIHDELMFEGPETLLRQEEPNFCQIMTSTMKLNVPIKVESKIVKTYGD